MNHHNNYSFSIQEIEILAKYLPNCVECKVTVLLVIVTLPSITVPEVKYNINSYP